jgi:hypothetical protein
LHGRKNYPQTVEKNKKQLILKSQER